MATVMANRMPLLETTTPSFVWSLLASSSRASFAWPSMISLSQDPSIAQGGEITGHDCIVSFTAFIPTTTLRRMDGHQYLQS